MSADPAIVDALPPNFDAILAAFPEASRPNLIFSYGDRIYYRGDAALPPELLAHEKVHCARQLDIGIGAWWERYIAETAFRLDEELLAHRAEYEAARARRGDRNAQARMLHVIAQRLSSPLYGGLLSYPEARRLIAGR